jgi:hypothetical protein
MMFWLKIGLVVLVGVLAASWVDRRRRTSYDEYVDRLAKESRERRERVERAWRGR